MLIERNSSNQHPFWWVLDEKFFNNALMTKLDVRSQNCSASSNQHPRWYNANSFRISIILWTGMDVQLCWISSLLQTFAGGGWKNVYRLESPDDFFSIQWNRSALMMLQEEINFTEYFRCYCLTERYSHNEYDPNSRIICIVRNPKPIEKTIDG